MSSEEQIKLEEEQSKATRTWLLSFIDLLSVILAFFVLLYSTKDTSAPQFMEIKDSFVKYINGKKSENNYEFVKKPGNSVIIKSATNLNYIETLFTNTLYEDLSLGIKVINKDNRITLEFEEYYKEESELANILTPKLIALSKTINSLTNQIQVETDTGDMKSNKSINEFIGDKIEELGYEHKILRTLPLYNNLVSETLEKNKKRAKIQIVINNYETVF